MRKVSSTLARRVRAYLAKGIPYAGMPSGYLPIRPRRWNKSGRVKGWGTWMPGYTMAEDGSTLVLTLENAVHTYAINDMLTSKGLLVEISAPTVLRILPAKDGPL